MPLKPAENRRSFAQAINFRVRKAFNCFIQKSESTVIKSWLRLFKLQGKRICFVTFADGTRFTGQRIMSQIEKAKIFTYSKLYTARDLPSDFYSQRKELYLPSPSRGYGYWSWKPYIMLNEAKKLKEGDLLIYCDSGCTFLEANAERAAHTFYRLAKTNGKRPMVAENYTKFFVKEWIKGDALSYFNLAHDHEFLNSCLWEAGRVGIVVSEHMLKFLEDWTNLCANHVLVSDSPSASNNPAGFNEHRHDQALFNLLAKKTGIETGLEDLFLATRILD